MRKHAVLMLCILSFYYATSQADTTQKIISGRKNSIAQQEKPYVIMISADGFRYDYAEKYNAKNLLAFSGQGVRAASMIPSYPTLTFPNHYSIVTGLYPSHHGLVDNYFYDPSQKKAYGMRDRKAVEDGSWYDGTPLWVLAEKQQMLTASFYWVGSEADIQHTLPTYYYRFNDSIGIDRRIQVVKEWLQLPAERRPHFITFYLPQADHEGHLFGPEAPQTGAAVQWIDSVINRLVLSVSATGLPVNYIFVSDHGMTQIDTANTLSLPADMDTSRFVMPRGVELVHLYAKNKKYIKPAYKKLKRDGKGFATYLRADIPAYLHYSRADDVKNRIGDILLIAAWPNVFNFWTKPPNPGAHGFDPVVVRDMHATFLAWGPAFKNLAIPSFENVNVYPVITKILGLTYTDKIDGTNELAEKIVR